MHCTFATINLHSDVNVFLEAAYVAYVFIYFTPFNYYFLNILDLHVYVFCKFVFAFVAILLFLHNFCFQLVLASFFYNYDNFRIYLNHNSKISTVKVNKLRLGSMLIRAFFHLCDTKSLPRFSKT